jgi:thiamine biosynthesis lipoprotein
MKRQIVSMGMPVTINVVDKNVTDEDINEVFSYFHYIDSKFSTYKKNSEISQINREEIKEKDFSLDMKKIISLCEKTKKETNGFFDINNNGLRDPSGIVKGYAINEGANILKNKGYKNIYVEIAGDIQVFGKDESGKDWKIGIQNPFNLKEIVKVVNLSNRGIATSGTYLRGDHIYNPKSKTKKEDFVSVTIIGPNVYEADRFATAVFAMGETEGLEFLVTLTGFEGYIIRKGKRVIYTPGFERYT